MVEAYMKNLIRKILLKLYYWVLPELYGEIMSKVYKQHEKDDWRLRNPHNSTSLNLCMAPLYDKNRIVVGKNVYGKLNVYSWGHKDEKLEIGDFCSIASNVHFILGGNHYVNHFSTYPFKRMILGDKEQEATTKGAIILEDDVWVGQDAIIMSGVRLGQGTIVAAGSVVTKSTEPYSIVGGNPARLIKYRFSDEVREKMLYVDLKKLDENYIKQNITSLYSDKKEDILCIIQALNNK